MVTKDLTDKKIRGYELVERIGVGGFGAVYRAHQIAVDREVAIKVILPDFANQPEFIRRFEAEAQVIARLEHPHIVPLHDYWRDPSGAYLVMRYLRGGSLKDELKHKAFTPEEVAELLMQISGALSLAHRHDIIHRDIKPGNILLDEDNNAYLADFGIAKDLTQPRRGRTRPDAIIGSLDYISPEQARNEPVSARTDIYSLGLVLYELLTGSYPFRGMSSVERLYKHINDPLPTIDALGSRDASTINAIIQKATAKNPDQRYQDVLELMSEYHQAVYGHEVFIGNVNPVALLTPREQEVLSLMIDGLSNRDIADRLVITIGTVKWYITQIYRKLQVRGRVQAIVRARELDFVVNDQPRDQVQRDEISAFTTEPDNPYKGLEAFGPADSQDYYGREELIDSLLARMAEEGPYGRFLAIIGPSGSGKSSLVKAGLIPALWCGGLPDSESWFIADMLPGSRPIDELEIALTRFATSEVAGVLGEHLRRDESGLVRVGQLILPDDGSELVVIVDQFEELFTLVDDEDKQMRFLNLLRAAVTDRRSRVRVIITLRADFYDRPLHYPEFGEMMRSRMETILPLSPSELERAIVKPASRVGVTFEEGLVTQIVSTMTYQPGALPLLQYCLTELFERREGRTLTHKAYHEMGGAVGALARRTEAVFNDLDRASKQLTKQMFLRLVTLGEGTEDMRRRVMQQELVALADQPEDMEEIIDLFAGYRLLSLDHDSVSRQPTVDVAHEAILREWEQLKSWLNESRQEIRLHRKLLQAVAEWQKADKDKSYLLQGARLDEFEQWRSTTTVALTPGESEYLDMCSLERQRRIEQEQKRQAHEAALERRSRRALQVLVLLLLFIALGSIGVSIFAVNSRNRTKEALTAAERQADVNHSLVLSSNASEEYESGYADLALLLALEAVSIDEPPVEAIQALTQIALRPGTRMVLPDYNVSALQFSPDGQTLLTAACVQRFVDREECTKGQFVLRDVASGKVLKTAAGHTGWINQVVFNPQNPAQVVSASDDRSLLIWDLEDMTVVHTLTGHRGAVNDVVFINDGAYIVSASDDKTLIIWDVRSGEIVLTLDGHKGPVNTLDVSPDGLWVISGSSDKTIMLWNMDPFSPDFGALVQTYQGHDQPVTDISFVFDRDGLLRILSRSNDLTTNLWDIETGAVIRSMLTGVNFNIFDVSTDRQRVFDQSDLLWEVRDWGQNGQWLHGASADASLRAIDFNPPGTLVATAEKDGTVRLWDVVEQADIRRYNFGGGMTSVLTDGTHLLVGGADVYWLDIASGNVIYDLSFENGGPGPGAISLSADSRYALVLYQDVGKRLDYDIARVWDLQTGTIISEFNESRFPIRSAALSPDGNLALVGAQVPNGDALEGQTEFGDLFLYNAQTGDVLYQFDTTYDAAGMRFNADASLAVTCSGATEVSKNVYEPHMQLWDIATGERIQDYEEFPDGTLGIIDCAFGPDESTLLAASISGEIYELDIETGELLRTFSGHNSYIFSIDLSPDGKYLVSGSADFTVILWDYNTGELLDRFEGHEGWPVDVAFHPDGESVFSAGLAGTVRQWSVGSWPLDELEPWIWDNRYVGELSCDERETYRIEPLCGTESQ